MSALPSGWHEKWGFLRPRAPGPRRALPSHPGAAARVPARFPARPERAGRRAAERAQLRARHSPPPASRGSAAGAPAASSGGAPAPPPAARSATPRRGGARLHRGADASSASEAALPGASPPRSECWRPASPPPAAGEGAAAQAWPRGRAGRGREPWPRRGRAGRGRAALLRRSAPGMSPAFPKGWPLGVPFDVAPSPPSVPTAVAVAAPSKFFGESCSPLAGALKPCAATPAGSHLSW